MSTAADRIARCLYIAIAGLMALFIITFALHKITGRVPSWFLSWVHINAEYSLPAWFNAGLLLTTALLMAVAAATSTGHERTSWWVLAVLVGFLSMDEASGFHERLGRIAEWLGWDLGSFMWLGPGLILAAAGVTALVFFGRSVPRTTGVYLFRALIVFGFSAVGIELITGLLFRRYGTDAWFDLFVHPALQVIEESGEKVACVMAVHAMLRLLTTRVTLHQVSQQPSD